MAKENREVTKKSQKKIIRSHTNYTPKLLDKMAMYFLKRNVIFILTEICGGLILLCGIFIAIVLKAYVHGIIDIVFGIFFLLYWLILRAIKRRQNKRFRYRRERYTFLKDHFVRTTLGEDDSLGVKTTIDYSHIHSVREDKNKREVNMAYIRFDKDFIILIKRNFDDDKDFYDVINNMKVATKKKTNKVEI